MMRMTGIAFWLKSAVQQGLRKHGREIVRQPLIRLLHDQQINVVLDVGASVGGYGSELRRRGYKGRIVSFEPLPHLFQALEGLTQKSPRWTALPLAVGNETGTALMYIASNGDSSSLLPMLARISTSAPSIVPSGEIRVNIVRLDDVYRTYCAPGDRVFLKIDVQGFEDRVLEGANRSLPCVAGLQLELSLVELYDGQVLIEDLIGWLRDRGFAPVWFIHGFRDPLSSELLQVDGIFLRTRSSAEKRHS